MRTWLVASVILVAGVTGCSSSGGGGGGERSVIDLTWGRDRGYDAGYSRSRDRYRELVTAIHRYDRAYYESHVRTTDASGQPIKPVEQVTFQEVEANIPEATVTTAGAKTRVADDGEEAVFIDSNGNEVRLSSYRGKPVVLVFTRGFPGYICPMCTTYTAQITLNYDKFVAQGAEVLVVFPGETSEVDDFTYACNEILEEEGRGALPFPVLLDPDLKAVSRFNIRADLAFPATYIFDEKGVMRWGFVGEQPHERPSVECLLRELKALK